MRKLYLLATMVAMVACLTACGGDEVQEIGSESTSSSEAGSAAAGYTWEVDGVELYIDATPEETVDLIEEEAEYFESPSCAYDGTDKIYTYNNYVVTFYESEDNDGISLITLTSDLVSTDEGISIGSSHDDIIEAYGDATSDSDTLVTYEDNGTELRFVLMDDAVISIEISKIF